jgi:hypothetical protein
VLLLLLSLERLDVCTCDTSVVTAEMFLKHESNQSADTPQLPGPCDTPCDTLTVTDGRSGCVTQQLHVRQRTCMRKCAGGKDAAPAQAGTQQANHPSMTLGRESVGQRPAYGC